MFKKTFSERKQIRLRPDQLVYLKTNPENDSVIIRRALDEYIERQKNLEKNS